jgi:ferredoxin-nitrite reductase
MVALQCCTLALFLVLNFTHGDSFSYKKHAVLSDKKYDYRSHSVLAANDAAAPAPVAEVKVPAQIYQAAAALGGMKMNQSPLKIFILSILSGCHIAFGAYLMLSVGGACPGIAKENPGLQKILMGAFGLPFGLMMTIIGGGELFTGNTALGTAALVEGTTTKKDVLMNWVVSYAGNFLGSLLLAYLAHTAGTLGAAPAAVNVAVLKSSLTFSQAFTRGLLCNWLVCMAVWMASGASSLPGKMTAIFFPISAFVALGLEHSVANMFLIPLGMLRGAEVSIADFLLKNLLPVTLGNIVGGAIAVAGSYSAAFGKLLAPKEPVPAKVTSIRAGWTPPAPDMTKLGNDYLSEETIERAKVGNPFEKTKLKRDPTLVWDDVHEFAAAIREGKTNWEDIAKDDIDIRVKYAGMFHRGKRTPGKFMMRLRIPNGIVTSDQMRYFGESVRPWGPEVGVVDITTRANIQLRGMPLEGASDIYKGLQERGMTSVMSGLDNVRNMVGSPIAGIDPHEQFDTRALTAAIDNWYSGNGKGNPMWCNMPRKFNICVSGSRDDFAHTHINDIGLQACAHATTGEMGFNVVLGGYFSIKRAAEAIPMGVWIQEKDVLNLCQSILRVFRDEGTRKDRQKARLMWLIEEYGLEAYKQKIQDEMATNDPTRAGMSFEPEQPQAGEWTQGTRNILGVHAQKQEGLSWVGVHVPVGRLSADECDTIADLADKYSNGEVRMTVEQNFVFPNVDNAKIDAFLAEPALQSPSRLSTNPGNILGGLVSCTGAQFCGLAMVETKLTIDEITRKVSSLVTTPKPVRIHMTGCPNSCGQVQVADIGIMGSIAKRMDPETGKNKAIPGVDIFVGGTIGEHMHLSTVPLYKGVAFDDHETIVPLLVEILKERHGAVMR